ncbi:MAG: YihY/virulence factor BrkB family protein [Spirochaetales bacterium]|nr:YihY/virulence factor BrkB family protein [Spirochaetales bacterium]
MKFEKIKNKIEQFFKKIKLGFKRSYLFLIKSWVSFTRDNGFILASSLVHSTLISLVPFFALLYALLSSFGTFKTKLTEDVSTIIADFVSNVLIPIETEDIVLTVKTFVENTKSLGFVGLLVFAITSFFLVNRIWGIFNQLYKTKASKNTFSQFISYLFFLILGSFLLGFSLTLTSVARKWLINFLNIGIYEQIIIASFQLLIFLVLLFLMIKFIPSTYVKTTSALLAAFIGTIVWYIVSNLYIFLFTGIIDFGPIYNSLASIIVFIFWVYTAWIIIFFSVKVSYVHQYKPHISRRDTQTTNATTAMVDSLDILILIAQNFTEGKGETSIKDLSTQLKINDTEIINCVNVFVENKILLEINSSTKKYTLARPLEKIKLNTLFSIIAGENKYEKSNQTKGSRLISTTFHDIEDKLEAMTLKELVEQKEIQA